MTRGDIYWANLSPRSGSEQKGKRPLLIVSNDGFNRVESWRSLIVVPLSTSAAQAKRGPTAIRVAKGTAGLKSASLVLCHQVTTIDRSKLITKIGTLSKLKMQEIDQGLLAARGLAY